MKLAGAACGARRNRVGIFVPSSAALGKLIFFGWDIPALPAAPPLSIFCTTTNTVAVTCPSPSTGWTLQQNTNSVGSVNWSNVTSGIQDDGTTKTLMVSPPAGNRFHRLHKP